MAEAVHELDPCADTILVLKNAGAPFAVWDEPFPNAPEAPPPESSALPENAAAATAIDIKRTKKKKGKKGASKALIADELPSTAVPVPSDPMEGPSVARETLFGGEQSSLPEASSSSQLNFEAPELKGLEEPSVPVENEEPPVPVENEEPPVPVENEEPPARVEKEEPPAPVEEEESGIHYHVSSRHLALASGFFKSSLAKDGWMEGRPSAADGKYHLSATDWDPEALLIVLNVLHLRNCLVPRSLTLEMLAKVAVLMDYYRCSEAIGVFSEIWIDAAKKTSPIPSTYGRDLVLWMSVAWVFKLPAEFEQTTNIAFRQCKTPTIQDMCLPIPKPVLDGMEHKRYQTIEELISSLHSWLDKFRGSSHMCRRGTQYNFACSSMLLGALTKEMDRIGCLNPRPEVPFTQLSFDGLYSNVHGMTSPTWSEGYYGNIHPCGFQDTVKTSADQINTLLAGLSLRDFKDRGEDW